MNSSRKQKLTSRIVKWILRPFFHSDSMITIIDDLEEGYFIKLNESGKLKAKIWYFSQLPKIILGKIYNSIIWSVPMLENYLKTAIRNIFRHKVYYSLNILGLGLGLAFFIMCIIYAAVEFNYDRFRENPESIFGVVKIDATANNQSKHSALMPPPMLPAMMEEFPEIQKGTRFMPAGEKIVRWNDKILYEQGIIFVDPSFLSMFSFNLIKGDPLTILSEPFSAVISLETAKKYFGNIDPVGKVLTVDNHIKVIIKGVIEDSPDNSSLYYNILVSFKTLPSFNFDIEDWKTEKTMVLLKLNDKNRKGSLEDKLQSFLKKHYSSADQYIKQLYLFPFLDFRLNSRHIYSFFWRTNKTSIYILNSISAVLLIIACFNFINLSTAKSITRMREIGIRSSVGANRSQLVRQFLGESITVSLLSVPVAVLIYELLILPYFKAIFGIYLNIYSLMHNPSTISTIFFTSIILGIMAGAYPAFTASRLKISNILKNNSNTGTGGLSIRRTLIVSQFIISIIAIVLTVMIREQQKFILEYDLGYNRENIIVLRTGSQISHNYEVFRTRLLSRQDIISVSTSAGLATNWKTEGLVIPEGKDKSEAVTMNTYGIYYDFVESLNMQVLNGRSFSRDFLEKDNILINESAGNVLGFDNPIGKILKLNGKNRTIIGVIKDFHFKDLYWDILPTVLFFEPERLNYIYIKHEGPYNSTITIYRT